MARTQEDSILFMEETNRRVTAHTEPSEFFYVPKPRRKLGIFPNPRAYMEEIVRRKILRTSLRSVLRQLAVFKGEERLDFFPRPKANLEREIGIFLSLRNMKKFEGNIKSYEGNMLEI